MDLLSRTGDLLLAELAGEAEAGAGFPKVTRIPSSGTIRFLDYFASLPVAERGPLLEATARAGAMCFFPPPLIARAYEELRTTNPACVQLHAALQSPFYSMGLRYCGLGMAKAMLNDPQSVVQMAKTRATLDFEPRDDPPKELVHDADLRHVQPAKAPLLRKLVNGMMRELLSAKGTKRPGGDMVYSGAIGTIALTVSFFFTGWSGLRHGVTAAIPERGIRIFGMTYGTLWSDTGWDYLTEENAARSMDLLRENLVFLAQFLERIRSLPASAEG
ncbi:MAG TPA: hypothetical protein VEU62_05370 [Bryobacterales bacterium]|nr:hypothetical protein [Bryobacterales bacterium]